MTDIVCQLHLHIHRNTSFAWPRRAAPAQAFSFDGREGTDTTKKITSMPVARHTDGNNNPAGSLKRARDVVKKIAVRVWPRGAAGRGVHIPASRHSLAPDFPEKAPASG